MTNLVSNTPPGISVRFLKDFPSGFSGNTHQRIESGFLTEKLIEHYGNRLSYNLLSLEPEIDGNAIDIEYCQLFYQYLSLKGYKIAKDIATDCLLVASQQYCYHPVNSYLERIAADDSIKPINLETVATDYLGTNSPL